MVEGIPEFVAVVSCDGTILITNQLWDRELDVGILGMEERVRELRGRFSIHRLAEGTLVRVSLPRKKSDCGG
jgi:glucose-6-phosphate-specific signal transduction histidine kinase